ncbi:double-strand break repair helicase AddA [Novosphingobium sp. ZN18A2]|uniref:double-strand break repair helicase AddA n=1 Tax=Novosphingobium sp. ZN18A2 TaxID=3079861 RepID=UPI0030D5172F
MAGPQPPERRRRRRFGRRGVSKVFPLKDNQARAVDPMRTVWLSASAGTGKTQVLSARVLRLLLQQDVEPEHVLCLTFTKAGAAEMATRVNDVLARWVRLDDARLAAELNHIGAPVDDATRKRARSRFAAVLDCPGGGLRIETIHAFSQWLLSAFPVEAGLTPGTRAMEDRDRDLLLRQVLADLLIEADERGDDALLDTLADLSLRMDQSALETFLLRCAAARDLWFGAGSWNEPLRSRINGVIGLPPQEVDGTVACATLCADDAFDIASVRYCMAVNAEWGTKTGIAAANAMGDWLAADAQARLAGFEDFCRQFLTAKGEPRSTTSLDKRDPEYSTYAARVIASIEAVRERKALVALADLLDAALTLGRRFAIAWDAAKKRESYIDFDDQIRFAADLLKRRELGEWVRYKLDRRFDHILVDEAQDTNAAQWEIVLDGLIGDFFSGEGQHGDAMRTLFVVGDYKQAIFRFQGTSPENFDRARQRVRDELFGLAEASRDADRELLDLGLGRSYRTARPVLEFVDRAIGHIGYAGLGLQQPPEAHVGEDRPGLVALWRPVGQSADEEDEPEDEGAGDGNNWLSRPDRMLADTLARQVRAWLETGVYLEKHQRNAQAGDIMVLVRKRKDLAGLIVARLHAQGVPVAGVDRLRLGAPLAVKDLVAALRFALQPLDDLNLANLLVSPLIGWSQKDLLDHAYRDKGLHLWDHLRATESAQTHPAMEMLRAVLARADLSPPQELLHWLIAGPWQARRKLVARLGREVNDPVDELLNAAMAFAASGTPSLAGFLQWFDAGEGELKRESDQSGGMVRVMTVHGAKGLQAPIVILADAVDDPESAPPRGLELEERVIGGKPHKVPLPPLRKEEKAGPVLLAETEAAKAEREEHWRLLYVAMTRAEEALFIGGALGKRQTAPPPESWYGKLAALFPDDTWQSDPLWGGCAEWGALSTRSAPPSDTGVSSVAPVDLPDWLLTPVGPEPRPPRPLAPSSLGEEDAPDPPPKPGPGLVAAARRGTLMHKLIERLPERAPDQRMEAAEAWLARMADDIDPAERTAMARRAVNVLSHPGWQDVFGQDSLAEVPVAALVDGRMVAGTIDRLVIGDAAIRIVDFKTARRPPTRIEEIPAAYLKQMAAYGQALGAIHPGRRVEAALLYTQTPEMFVLPDALIEANKLDSQV